MLVKNKVRNFDNNSKEFSYHFLFKKLMKKISFTYQLLGQEEINRIFIFRKKYLLAEYFLHHHNECHIDIWTLTLCNDCSKSVVACAAYFLEF